MSNTPPEALRRIEECARLKANKLDLSHLGLTEIPKEINGLGEHLLVIYLDRNQISKIENLDKLSNIRSLYLQHNRISKIENLGNLKKLYVLFLQYNQISKMENLKELSNLIVLALVDNEISKIENLEKLENLVSLSLNDNQVFKIEGLNECSRLINIGLTGNKINKLDSFLPFIKNDWEIDLKEEIYLKNDKRITLKRNPLPQELITLIELGNDAILNYYEKLEEEKEYLNEAKVLVVGDAETGKTSLIEKIIDTNAKLPKKSDRTLSIKIKEHSFGKDENEVIAHIWDFGGQIVYDASHRIFYSDDCLYVLLTGNNKEDKANSKEISLRNRIVNIEIFGGKSPILIVNNEFYGFSSLPYDISRLKSDDSFNICKEFSLDLERMEAKDENELNSIRNHIHTTLLDLGIMKVPYPGEWKRVKELLPGLKKENDFLSLNEFFKAVFSEMPDKKDVQFLLRQFHKRGFLMWFENVGLLAEKVFINPQWAVDGVNYIIANADLKNQQGVFTKEKAKEILSPHEKYEYNISTVLELMKQFRLCYNRGMDENEFVIPSLLPYERPTSVQEWKPEKQLILSYEYNYLPKGIINQLTCLLFDKLEENGVWKNGCIINYDNSRALIIEKDTKLEIKIEGNNRRGILTYILDRVEEIHKNFYKGIYRNKSYDIVLECPCETCISNPNVTQDFKYDWLIRKFEENSEKMLTCNESDETYSILELLHNVGFPEERIPRKRDEMFGHYLNSPAVVNNIHLGNKPEKKKEEKEIIHTELKKEEKGKKWWQNWGFISLVGCISLILISFVLLYYFSVPYAIYISTAIGLLGGGFIYWLNPKWVFLRAGYSLFGAATIPVISSGLKFTGIYSLGENDITKIEFLGQDTLISAICIVGGCFCLWLHKEDKKSK